MRTLKHIALAAFLAAAPLAAFADLQSDLIVGADATTVADGAKVTETTFIAAAEKYLIGLVAVVAVCVFLWIGYNMLTAEGDPEKFKSAQKALTYAVMGLALIPLAYVIVRLVVSINF